MLNYTAVSDNANKILVPNATFKRIMFFNFLFFLGMRKYEDKCLVITM